MPINDLLEERGAEYGTSHVLAGKVIGLLADPFVALVHTAPELVHDWVLMLSKLIRILHSPYKLDSYDDLIGYAELAKRTISERMK